jgi:hypothetical protein
MGPVRASGAATCPFAACPATPGRDARLIGVIFQQSERRGIKALRLHQDRWRDAKPFFVSCGALLQSLAAQLLKRFFAARDALPFANAPPKRSFSVFTK